jgi:alkaline phosphatase D
LVLGGAALALPAPRAAVPYPFTLGVGSGDPMPDSVVLWTRLSPATRDAEVTWELAADERFKRVVRTATVTARATDAHSVHVIPTGLTPGAWYWYRFRTQGHVSPVGRTRTAPAPGGRPAPLRFAFASCQHLENGWYHAHHFMAQDDPDLILWLGDYIYEKPTKEPSWVRRYTIADEADTLAEYRQRYAQTKADPSLREAHAAAPWVVVFDDHEVKNDWAGKDTVLTSPEPASPPVPAERRAAAFKAWWEHTPTRVPRPSTSDISLYRRFRWGSLARFHMLDTRQYRDEQALAGDCAAMRDPNRSIMGAQQERWLLDELARPVSTWDVLGQQVFFAQRDLDGDSTTCRDLTTDSWDGYAASRRRITQGWVDRKVRNLVVLTGDVHRHWAAELHVDYAAGGRPVGTEFVGSAISSVGDPVPPDTGRMPHVRYIGNQRGYVRCTLTPERLLGEWMGVSSVVEPDLAKVKASVVRRYVVEDRVAGLRDA